MDGLKHPNVIELLGYGTDVNGQCFMLLELMENGSLKNGKLYYC